MVVHVELIDNISRKDCINSSVDVYGSWSPLFGFVTKPPHLKKQKHIMVSDLLLDYAANTPTHIQISTFHYTILSLISTFKYVL